MKMMKREEAIKKLSSIQLSSLTVEERKNFLIDVWTIRENDPAFVLLPSEIRTELRSSECPRDCSDQKYNSLILLALSEKWRGVKNEFIAGALNRIGIAAQVVGEVENLHPCPCCGYRTLPNRRELDVCRVCMWEDDGTETAECYSSPNHLTLGEAQTYYAKLHVCSPTLAKNADPDASAKYARAFDPMES